MRTRARFAILFACVGVAVMAVGVAAIYEAVGRDSARRIPAEAEALLASAARRAIDGSIDVAERLEGATRSLIAARALLAEARIMGKDAVIRLALEIAAILAAVLAAAALAFFLLSRLITKSLDELAAGAIIALGDVAQGDRAGRFQRSSDPDLDAVARALNELLDLTAEQERRLAEAARLEGWREVASFLAHQLKNPLAAVLLAAKNGSMALDEGASPRQALARESLARENLAQECLEIVRVEADRLRALIDRFRDLAPSGLDAYGSMAEIDLRALLQDCAARAERSGAAIVLTGPSVQIAGDRGLLEQAFWNLFANSIEAAGGNGSAVSIQTGIVAEGKKVIVSVIDSNRGIDPALVPRLSRERISTKAEGTGLGLLLVRRIFAAQGGSLELFVTESGGLGARAVLPRAAPPAARGERKAI